MIIKQLDPSTRQYVPSIPRFYSANLLRADAHGENIRVHIARRTEQYFGDIADRAVDVKLPKLELIMAIEDKLVGVIETKTYADGGIVVTDIEWLLTAYGRTDVKGSLVRVITRQRTIKVDLVTSTLSTQAEIDFYRSQEFKKMMNLDGRIEIYAYGMTREGSVMVEAI